MSSNRDKGNSSFWRSNGSNKDKQSAHSGSAQPNSSSAFRSGWGRPPSSSDRPTAGSGGWGRPSPPPNFACVLIAALLLLPGVTHPIADEFTQDYIQRNHIVDPHTQDDIDRAIAAFNRKHPQKAPAPPEGYTVDHVSHCFNERYELPENLREGFEGFVQSYITKNPKPFSMNLTTAVDRALFRIREELQTKLRKTIPEKDSHPLPAPAPLPLQRPPQPSTRNSNNLFGQLLRFGRPYEIPEHKLIDYLRWWTSLPEIREIAEEPTAADVEYGLKEMLKVISPGAVMFRDVCERGLSPETLGQLTFDKLMRMNRGPKIGQVWAIQSCPDPYDIMKSLSFKEGLAHYRHASSVVYLLSQMARYCTLRALTSRLLGRETCVW
jgi:hypothetical protein